jgi:hypothetical protein
MHCMLTFNVSNVMQCVPAHLQCVLLQVIGRLANGLALSPSQLAHCGELFQTWQQALFVAPVDLPGR